MRKTLFLSALLFLFSVTMFIGTTYAWFSEDVTINDNRIVVGKLDMEVTYTDVNPYTHEENVDFTWETLIGDTKLFDVNGDDDWIQPNSTENRWVKIRNVGNIPLKFRIITTNVETDEELIDSIIFNATVNTQEFTGVIDDFETNYIELNPTEYIIVPITMHVDECLGNEAMLKALQFDIEFQARQIEWSEDTDECEYLPGTTEDGGCGGGHHH